jgi:diguanylate cyclase (GGDEF)-like protein
VLIESAEQRHTAAEVAARIIDAAGRPFTVEGHDVAIGVSIGIALHPDDGVDVRTILQSADRAMYRAKVASGNAFQFHSE